MTLCFPRKERMYVAERILTTRQAVSYMAVAAQRAGEQGWVRAPPGLL